MSGSTDWDSFASADADDCNSSSSSSREQLSGKRAGKQFNFFGRSNDAIRCDNVLLKVLNRQHSGYFSSGLNKRSHQAAFREVPEHLSFCLKEIVPYCYLQGLDWVGLSGEIVSHGYFCFQSCVHGSVSLRPVPD